ncbi:MAG: hypothetical protein M3N51_09295 [Actinomycetota bacterium]|nr:hypothetical protein [Actinomycetota bacterium]
MGKQESRPLAAALIIVLAGALVGVMVSDAAFRYRPGPKEVEVAPARLVSGPVSAGRDPAVSLRRSFPPATATVPAPVVTSTTVGVPAMLVVVGGSAEGTVETWTAAVTVEVLAQDGTPIPGVTVAGIWSGGALGLVGRATGEDGVAHFELDGLHGGQVAFTVVKVLHPDYRYEPGGSTTVRLDPS